MLLQVIAWQKCCYSHNADILGLAPRQSYKSINICYLPAGRSVLEKYFVEVSKTARDRRSRDVFETETKYFSVRTDLKARYQ